MSEERVIIEPQISRLQRIEGWFLIALSLPLSALLFWRVGILPAPFPPSAPGSLEEVRHILLESALALIFCGALTIWGICQALETQKWIAGPDFFECRSQLLGLRWRKTYHAEYWNFECISYDSNDRPACYALRPVGTHVRLVLVPFYRTYNGHEALDLGRQLALATGWPLNLPINYERLRKELQT
jgi:hypothetical protein